MTTAQGHTPTTMVPGITFKGTFEPDGKGTYQIIGGATKADGQFICRAVNSYEALAKACRKALRHFEAWEIDSNHSSNAAEAAAARVMQRVMRDALAKAEGAQ